MKAEKAIKEFAEKVAAKVTWAGAIGIDKNWLVEPLTALISEHYVAKEEVDKMVSERMEQYKAQFKDRPNPLEVNPYDSKGIKRIRNRKIH